LQLIAAAAAIAAIVIAIAVVAIAVVIVAAVILHLLSQTRYYGKAIFKTRYLITTSITSRLY
jgi:hypothetical protein